jgi:hypothetical protein
VPGFSPWIALQRCWQAWSNAPWKRQGITFGTPVQRSAQGLLISELLEFIGASSTVESASACCRARYAGRRHTIQSLRRAALR